MAFAMAGTFLASDGLLYYIFWELSLIPIYFIASFGIDVEERKKAVVKFFIYTSGIFIYANCLCLFIPTSGKFFIRRFI
jgi:NADH-quinone oxidoreductase subunit M